MTARTRAAAGGRTRDWLIVLGVLLLIGTYWVVWTSYVTLHTVSRYVAAAPGAPYVHEGQTLQAVSLTRTTTLSAEDPDRDPQVAPPGTTYVVAVLTVTVDRPTAYGTCSPDLLGPDRQVWEPMLSVDVSRQRVGYCSDLVPGTTTEFEQIYAIPTAVGEQLRGLAFNDHASSAPVPVISPPR